MLQNGQNPSTRRRLKKLAVILCASLGIIILLILLRPLYLPDSFLIRQAEKKLAAATGLVLRIENGRIRLLGSIFLQGIELQDSTGLVVGTADELHLRYNLLPLFKRHLLINELTLNNPVLNTTAFVQTAPSEGEEKLAAIVAAKQSESRLQDESPQRAFPFEFDLPLTVEIQHLYIRNAGLKFLPADSTVPEAITLTGLDFESQRLRIKNDLDFNAQFALRQTGRLNMALNKGAAKLTLTAPVELQADGEIGSVRSNVGVVLHFTPTLSSVSEAFPSSPLVLPQIDVEAEVEQQKNGDFALKNFYIAVDGTVLLKANGVLQDIRGEPDFSLRVQQGQLDLGLWWHLLGEGSQLWGIVPALQARKLSGRLILNEANLKGTISKHHSRMSASVNCALQKVSFRDGKANLAVSNISATSQISAQVLPFDSLSFRVDGDVHIGMLSSLSPNFQQFSLSDLDLDMNAGWQSGWWAPQVQIAWRGMGPWNCRLKGSFSGRADRLLLSRPFASPGFAATGGGSFDNVALDSLFPGKFSGYVTTAFDVSMRGQDDIQTQLGILGSNIGINVAEKGLSIPDLMFRLSGNVGVSSDFKTCKLREIKVEVSPYFQLRLCGELDRRLKWNLPEVTLHFATDELLSLLTPVLPPKFRDAAAAGTVTLSGSARGRLDSAGVNSQQRIHIEGFPLSLSLPEIGISADSVALRSSLQGDIRRFELSGDLQVTALEIKQFLDQPYRNVEMGWKGQVNGLRKLNGGSLWVAAPNQGLRAEISGRAAVIEQKLLGSADLNFRFASADQIQLSRVFSISGTGNGNFNLRLPADQALRIAGFFRGDSLSLRLGELLNIEKLDISFPLTSSVHLDSAKVKPASPEEAPLGFQNPVLFSAVEHQIPPGNADICPIGRFRCRRIQVANYEAADLNGYLQIAQGRLSVPRFCVNAYGGEVQGALGISISALKPDSVNYWIRLNAARLNSALLPGVRAPAGSDAEISAVAHFAGQGLYPQRFFSLQGGLNITHIGRRVADNLLRFLDPDENNPSVKTYRKYLQRGWGVKVFSFNVKNDFVYVSITPARPPISKLDMFILSRFIGLGKSITFGRVPLKFFLTAPGGHP